MNFANLWKGFVSLMALSNASRGEWTYIATLNPNVCFPPISDISRHLRSLSQCLALLTLPS